MDMLTRLMIVSIVCCFFIQQSQGSQIVSYMLGRKLQQEETLNSEQIRLTSEECNPTQQDCTKSEDCDEIPPSGLFTCQWYAENGACSGIDTTFCRTSCNRCGCEDVEFPGLQCSYILSAQLCATPEIVQGKYCQRACGVCDTINQNQISTVNVNASAVASNTLGKKNAITANAANTANAISSIQTNDADVAEESQATVLIEFTSNLPRDSTSLFNWVGEDPCENWVGITCENSEITEIRLRQNLLLQEKLQTSIPSALSTFKNLKFVDFSEMKLTGMLPPELSTLVQLENIDISQNSLTGKIPVEYSTWTSLKFVYFNDNSFADVLHKQFSTWDQIMALNFDECGLFGTLPVEYSVFNNFQIISFNYNQLRGTLPVEFSAMSAFEKISLNSNFLTGSLPEEFSVWGESTTPYFVDNILTGVVPSGYSELADLYVFNQKKESTLCIDALQRLWFGSHIYSNAKLCCYTFC